LEQSSERRRHERFTFKSLLEVRLPGQLHWLVARACDVSVGGLCFETESPLEIGARIRLGLPNSEGNDFVLEATVRHVRAHEGRYLIGAERHSSQGEPRLN
jgi:hypothetical protein